MSPTSLKISASLSDESKELPDEKDNSASLFEASNQEGVQKSAKCVALEWGGEFSTDAHQDSLETKLQLDIRYTVICKDGAAMRSKQYNFTHEPFQELVAPEPEEVRPPMVIEVLMEAEGVGSSPTWKRESLGPNVGPYAMTIAKRKQNTTFTMARIHTTNSDGDTTEASSDEDETGPGTNPDPLSTGDTSKETSNNISDFSKFVPSSVSLKGIRIHSRNLVKLFRQVVRIYPGRSFTEDTILLEHPFLMLGHYYKELMSLREGIWSNFIHEDSPPDERQAQLSSMARLLDSTTIHDLNILLDYFKHHYAKNYEPLEAKFENGYTSYTSLAFLFKPGSTVYARIAGKLAGFIYESGEEKKKNSQWYWKASCWCLAYDGRRIFRSPYTFKIDKFRGDKEIISLRVFPSICLDSSDGGKTKTRLQYLGEKFYSIIRECPAHRKYEGPCLSMEKPNQKQAYRTWSKKKPDTVSIRYPKLIFLVLTRKIRNIQAR